MTKTTYLKTALFAVFFLILNISAWSTTVTHTFIGTSGTIDSNLSFSTDKNEASSVPAFNTSSNDLRLYYSSTGNGCSLTLTPSNGAIITDVKLTASSANYTPTVKYNVNGGADATATLSSTVYTISGINASNSLKLRNANTTNTQLRVISIEVTYSLAISCTASNLAFSQSSINKLVTDASFTQTATTLNGTTPIVYSSTNTGVATVNETTGEVTIVGTGSSDIIASQDAGTHNSVAYCSSTATYTINVTSAAPTITVTEVTVPDMVAYAGESDSETINISGINLSENISLSITGTNANQFSLSTNSVAQTSGTAANTVVTVYYSPTSTGAHTATLNVTSAGATSITRALNGSASWAPLAKPVLTGATNVSANALTLNWNAVNGAIEYEVNVNSLTTGGGSNAADLFISEYVEGSSYNKAIEIYNGTGASVDLSSYSLFKQINGAGSYTNELKLSGIILNGDVFVMAYVSGANSASSGILAVTDLKTNSATINYNGNDAVALFKNGVQIDEVGIFNQVSPNWGTDVTMIRKSTSNVPKATFDLSDWDIKAKDYIDNLGIHTFTSGTSITPLNGSPFTVNTNSKELIGLNTATTYYYTVKAKNVNVVSELSDELAVATLGTETPNIFENIKLHVQNGNIIFNATANETFEIFNSLGQKFISIKTVEGINSVPVSLKGIVMVKFGNQTAKVIL